MLTTSPQVIKLWGDYAGPVQPSFPYLLFDEPQDKEDFETVDPTNVVSGIVDGVLRGQVYAASKTQCRLLADRVSSALHDAPLVFSGVSTAGAGTVSAVNGSTTLTFSVSQAQLSGLFLTVDGDTSNGQYLASGTGTSLTITPPFGGTKLAGATFSSATQAGLIYFRRTGHNFPVMTQIGPDGNASSFARVVQFRFLYEQTP